MPNTRPNWFMEHEQSDKEQFEKIGTTLSDMKENHLAHIQIAQEKQATDMEWIKWFLFSIAGGIGVLAMASLMK